MRAHIRGASEAQASSKSSRPNRAEAEGIKTKIDLSQISKPGDVLKAIISKQQPAAAPVASPVRPVVATPVETKPAGPSITRRQDCCSAASSCRAAVEVCGTANRGSSHIYRAGAAGQAL